jgi:hypothetical protein
MNPDKPKDYKYGFKESAVKLGKKTSLSILQTAKNLGINGNYVHT